MKKQERKENQSSAEEKIFGWWQRLIDPMQNRRGERAALRRAHTPQAVAMESAFYDLKGLFENQDLGRWQLAKLPLVAGVLAHVSENDPRPVPKALRGESTNPVMSDLRFRRLLRMETEEELYLSFIRLVRMLNGRANVRDLARSLLAWNDRIREKWAEIYYTGRELVGMDQKAGEKQEVA